MKFKGPIKDSYFQKLTEFERPTDQLRILLVEPRLMGLSL